MGGKTSKSGPQAISSLPVRRLPVARFNKVVNLTLSRLLKAANSDLSREQEVILRQLRVRDGISQVRLADLVNQDSNNISRTLTLLEARGLVRRVSNPSDRRSQCVEITEKGTLAHEKAFSAIEKYWSTSFQSFTEDEIESLSTLMQRMTDNLENFLSDSHRTRQSQ